jgi:hypothetical protein
MQVNFPDDTRSYDGANLSVRFAAYVDGQPVVCQITVEALEDHFAAKSPQETEVLDAFDKGRARIESVCTQALCENGGEAVILHSGLFRAQSLVRK